MNLIPVLDAVTDALNATALPAHTTFKRYRPLTLSGPRGNVLVPALSVAFAALDPTLIATQETYEGEYRLLISWYSGQMDTVEAGRINETRVSTSLDELATIVAEIVSWTAGEIPGLAVQHEAVLGEINSGPIEGGVLAHEIALTVRVWEL